MQSCFRDSPLHASKREFGFQEKPDSDFGAGRFLVNDEMVRSAPEQLDRVIRLRKAELIDGLVAEGGLGGAGEASFRQLARRLGAVFHYRYFEELERLREVYFHFDPEIDPQASGAAPDLETAYRSLSEE